jgi:(3,5-dihydroxyphenyl)acetyl-CoA 1,2-dioxygenase
MASPRMNHAHGFAGEVAGLAAKAGLSGADAGEWAASVPASQGPFPAAAAAVSAFLVRGSALAARLPSRRHRTDAEQAAADAISALANRTRDEFLRVHAAAVYDALTNGHTLPLRIDELVYRAADLVPGLVPSRAEAAAERQRPLPDKDGVELAQGILASHVLAVPETGRHLIAAMLRPVPEARDHLDELRSTGRVDLGPVTVTRQGPAGILELRNPRHLNAEDCDTLGPTECAADLILLDPQIQVGVFRGGVVDQSRYAGMRVFGAGLNLTHLYAGRLDYLFFLLRDLGYVHKIFRGITDEDLDPERTSEKLWIAVVERFAVGGACQLTHVVDHVIAERGARLFLPARKEGIIPGASNLRLPRFVGDRAARQAIFSGREWVAGEPDAAAICDEVVEQGDAERTLVARVAALTDSGLVNATANRRVMRIGQEPLEVFREYMATFALEQARCHLSPALVANLEVHWVERIRSRGGDAAGQAGGTSA